jgi:hypothetical protein
MIRSGEPAGGAISNLDGRLRKSWTTMATKRLPKSGPLRKRTKLHRIEAPSHCARSPAAVRNAAWPATDPKTVLLDVPGGSAGY